MQATGQLVATVPLLLALMSVCRAQCGLGIGERAPGDRLKHTITISNGPFEVAQQVELNIDYRVSPLENEDITFVLLSGTDRGCSASISNNVDRKKQLLGTVKSVSELHEFSVTIQVYSIPEK